MSVLGRDRILGLMKQRNLRARLIVTPILEERQIGAGSVDIRIGNEFIVVRRGNLPLIDPGDRRWSPYRAQTKHYANFRQAFE